MEVDRSGSVPGPVGLTAASRRAAIDWPFLVGLAVVRLVVYGLSSGPLAYGYMSDEYYYLACAEHLAWGYVDHPPLSIAVLASVRAVLGGSLLAIRLAPALAACATLVLTALVARELGGGRIAQRLAALAAVSAPVYLGMTGFYSMNAFEPVLWSAAALLVARLVGGADPRTWIGLGVVLGLGLLNKISTLWFGLGLGVGLVLTPERRWLATPWPWLAGLVAFFLFAPHVVWQVQHDWPTAEFMRNATTVKMVAKSPLQFAADQLLVMGPVLFPLWGAGLVYYFVDASGRRFQVLAWIWITVCVLLLATGSVRSSYLAPAYTVLIAAGGVAFERIARVRAGRWLPAAAGATIVLGDVAMAPLGIALLAPDRLVRYQRALGVTAPVDQVDELGELPLHFALRFGWDEVTQAVREALATLSPAERRRAVVLGSSFGDTAAVDIARAEYDLPRVIGGHNSYWIWGPGPADGDVLVAIAATDTKLRDQYREVTRVAEVDCRYCLPEVDRLGVYVCRGPRRSLVEWWPELKKYE